MADLLYGRRAKVTVQLPAGKSFSDVEHSNQIEINGGDDPDPASPSQRIRFKVQKTDQKEPNTCEITITNLTESTRSALQVKGMKVTLEAGYVATGMSRLFFGDSRTTDQVREGGDWQTVIRVGDGERSFRFARFNESFAAGVGAGDILRALANASGLSIGNIPTEVANISKTFDHGYTVSGLVSHSLTKLVHSIGYVWSVQDGALQVLRPNTSLEASIPEISPETGLVDSPEAGTPEKKGQPALIKFKCLLLPTRPAAKVRLKSERYNGLLRVKRCQFNGDTRGGEWHTEGDGIMVGA